MSDVILGLFMVMGTVTIYCLIMMWKLTWETRRFLRDNHCEVRVGYPVLARWPRIHHTVNNTYVVNTRDDDPSFYRHGL